MEEKIRFQMRISPETDQKVKAAIPLANCQSQNEFVEQALKFFINSIQWTRHNTACALYY